MKIKFLLVFMLSVVLCKEPNHLKSDIAIITFSDKDGISLIGEGGVVSGTKLTLNKSGVYLAQGSMEEANIVIEASQVHLHMQNLVLTSKETAPITVEANLKDIKITNVQNTTLNDLEDPSNINGECAVIKIKKNSEVIFDNQGAFNFNGKCKNVIKGGSDVSIIFEKSQGTYIIDGDGNGIATDGYLEFNGGSYIMKAGGDAIKCDPDEAKDNNGKILIKDGTFNIECTNDAFTASRNITIFKGEFNIKTENGHDSKTFNKTESSAKGFKLTNNATG